MNCREFRRKHDAYIDDTLSGVDIEKMARHCQLCEQCTQIDTRVRRALLVARNLPMVRLSPAFGERLQARLIAERALLHRAKLSEEQALVPRAGFFSFSAYAVIAAGVLIAAGLAGAFSLSEPPNRMIRLAPVVASRPEPEPSALTAPTMVASMPAGMPIWPAVFVAQQAPWHFASDTAGP
jgi:hypothetical protein